MISHAKLIANLLIIAGAALVGTLGGWNLGPLRLELASDQLAVLGAVSCAALAVLGCRFAVDSDELTARPRVTTTKCNRRPSSTSENTASNQAGTDVLLTSLLADSFPVTDAPQNAAAHRGL
jgi:hypothetical protein